MADPLKWDTEHYQAALDFAASPDISQDQRERLQSQIVQYETGALQGPSTMEWQLEVTGEAARRRARDAEREADTAMATAMPSAPTSDPRTKLDPQHRDYARPEPTADRAAYPYLLSGQKALADYGPEYQPENMYELEPSFAGINRFSADVLGTNVERYYEPSIDEFHRGAPKLFPTKDVSKLGKESEEYRLWADLRWADKYEDAKAKGYPVERVEMKIAQQTAERNIIGGLWSQAKRDIVDPLKAAGSAAVNVGTLGLGSEILAQSEALGSSPALGGRQDISGAEARQAMDAQMREHPVASIAGGLGGAMIGAPRAVAGALAPGAAAGSVIGRTGQAALLGGTTGALEAGAEGTVRNLATAARGEGTTVDVGERMALGGTLGTIFGGGLNVLGEAGMGIASRMRRQDPTGATQAAQQADEALISGMGGIGSLPLAPRAAGPGVLPQKSDANVAKMVRILEEYTEKPATSVFGKGGVRRIEEFEALRGEMRLPKRQHGDLPAYVAREFADDWGHVPTRHMESVRDAVGLRKKAYFDSPQGQARHSSAPAFEEIIGFIRKRAPGGKPLPLARMDVWEKAVGSISDGISVAAKGDPIAPGSFRLSWDEAMEILPKSESDRLARSLFGMDPKDVPLVTQRELTKSASIDIKPRDLDASQLDETLTLTSLASKAAAKTEGGVDEGYKVLDSAFRKVRDQFEPNKYTTNDVIVIPGRGGEIELRGWSAENHRLNERLAKAEDLTRATGIDPDFKGQRVTSEMLIGPLAERLSKSGGGGDPIVQMDRAFDFLLKGNPVAAKEYDRIAATAAYDTLRQGGKILHGIRLMIGRGGVTPATTVGGGDFGAGDFVKLRTDPIFRAVARNATEKGAPRFTGEGVVEAWRAQPTHVRSLVRQLGQLGGQTVKDLAGLRGGMTAAAGMSALDNPTVDDIAIFVGLIEASKELGDTNEQ